MSCHMPYLFCLLSSHLQFTPMLLWFNKVYYILHLLDAAASGFPVVVFHFQAYSIREPSTPKSLGPCSEHVRVTYYVSVAVFLVKYESGTL
jgi:hypothetical protein